MEENFNCAAILEFATECASVVSRTKERPFLFVLKGVVSPRGMIYRPAFTNNTSIFDFIYKTPFLRVFSVPTMLCRGITTISTVFLQIFTITSLGAL